MFHRSAGQPRVRFQSATCIIFWRPRMATVSKAGLRGPLHSPLSALAQRIKFLRQDKRRIFMRLFTSSKTGLRRSHNSRLSQPKFLLLVVSWGRAGDSTKLGAKKCAPDPNLALMFFAIRFPKIGDPTVLDDGRKPRPKAPANRDFVRPVLRAASGISKKPIHGRPIRPMKIHGTRPCVFLLPDSLGDRRVV